MICHALHQNVRYFVHALFDCLDTINLCMSICTLYVYIQIVKFFESPKALYKFSVIIIIILLLLLIERLLLLL